MPTPLLERDLPLALLCRRLPRPGQGVAGHCVLLSGEAGVGKTSLLRALRPQLAPGVDWLQGLCEPLLSPAPWGPLLDVLDALPPTLAGLIAEGRAAQWVMPELLGWLKRRARPLVLCIDDLQWADGASLDLLRFLARRIEGLPLLLLLSLRDDELPTTHPLHGVLAGLPPGATTRLALQPLSQAAVAQAARQAGRAPQGLFKLTRGNPFLLTELLQAPNLQAPASVRESVLARWQRLDEAGRAALALLAVSPVPLEPRLLDRLLPPGAADAAGTSGWLSASEHGLGFRHELARQALESSLPESQRRSLHARLLQALEEGPGQASAVRRLHHAQGAAFGERVAELAPQAATEAARAGDHREAARLLGLALPQMLDPAARAALLEQLAEQHELSYALDAARHALDEALALRERLGQPKALAEGAVRRARLLFQAGELQAGKAQARTAVQALEALGHAPALAQAYAVLAQLHLLDASPAAALHWGRRALALAEALGDERTRIHALSTVGAAELSNADLPEAWARLEESLRCALAQGWSEAAARAHVNLALHAIVHRQSRRWPALCEEALQYCSARDLDLYTVRLRLRRAQGWLDAGRWPEVEADLRELLSGPLSLAAMDRLQAEHLLALLQLRRGERSARAYWDRLLDGDCPLQPWPWYAPVPVAAVEAAWLLGRRDTLTRWARDWLPRLVAAGEPWRAGQLAVWLRRVGALRALPEIPVAAPCEAELRGDLDAAASAWGAVLCPYEQALSLLAGSVEQTQRALTLFERLGAAPAAALARRRLHEAGALAGLRGRSRATLQDPQGLTPRERRLFDELRSGASYAVIAARWHRSPRTVEQHAHSLVRKLGLRTRAELTDCEPPGAPLPSAPPGARL